MVPSFIATYDDIMPDELSDRVIEKHKELEENASISLAQGSVDNGGLRNRKDYAFYFEREASNLASEINVVLDEALARYIDEYPSIGMHTLVSTHVKVQRTPPKGGFHKWHCEKGMDINSARALVWMIYLNDTPKGEGTTEFLEQGAVLQPKKNSIVLFPADWTHTHRGNPVYTDDKYIATGWYYYHNL